VVGGGVDEKWTSDLAGVFDRPCVAVPVYVFAVGLGFATVLALALTPMAGHWGGEGETQMVLVDGVGHPGGIASRCLWKDAPPLLRTVKELRTSSYVEWQQAGFSGVIFTPENALVKASTERGSRLAHGETSLVVSRQLGGISLGV